MQHVLNWSEGAETIEILTRLYDSETDESLKVSIIRAFSSLKQKPAIRKLLEIARNDKFDQLRLEAIYSLKTSRDPEVLNFLENLIK